MTAESPVPTGRWRTALVMIARNEAAQIGRALDSVRPWVDELWVLDTGSTDDTAERARAAGAQVRAFHWVDDFSAARNAALDACQADWHIVVDADEWLIAGGPALAALRHTRPDFVGALEVDSAQADAAQGSAPSWLSRVLPGPVRYQGRVHEQPCHALPVRRLPVRLGHDGYRADALQAKAGRNARLLQRALLGQPDDPYLWYQSGKDHDVYERWTQAVDAFDQAEALLEGERPAWLHDLTVRRLHALKRCKHHERGLQLAEAGLQDWGGSPDFFFAVGDLLLDWAADRPDLAPGLLPMIEDAWQTCLRLGEHPENEGAVRGRGSHLAASNLALLYDVLNRPADAAQCRRRAAATA